MVNEDPVFYVGDQQRSWQRPNFQSHSADDKATLATHAVERCDFGRQSRFDDAVQQILYPRRDWSRVATFAALMTMLLSLDPATW
jgi:hypothetical protein